MRGPLTWLVAAALLLSSGAGSALAAGEAQGFTPYTFEPVFMSLYDNDTETAFLPSKGIFDYEGREMLPGGYLRPGFEGGPATTYFVNRSQQDSDDNTRKVFSLLELKITNFDQNRAFRAFNASDFFLESERGSVFPPHPFTVASTRRLAKPGEAVYITLGFQVPQGSYTLVYKDVDPAGKQVMVEIWRYDMTINRGPLAFIGRMTAGLVLRITQQVFVLIDGLVGGR